MASYLSGGLSWVGSRFTIPSGGFGAPTQDFSAEVQESIAELLVDLSAWLTVMQHGHHVASRKEVLSKCPGLLSTLCVDQRPDDFALRDLNGQVEQLAHSFLAYTLA